MWRHWGVHARSTCPCPSASTTTGGRRPAADRHNHLDRKEGEKREPRVPHEPAVRLHDLRPREVCAMREMPLGDNIFVSKQNLLQLLKLSLLVICCNDIQYQFDLLSLIFWLFYLLLHLLSLLFIDFYF